MAKNKTRKQKREQEARRQLKENMEFLKFLIKLHEALTIVLDHNIFNKIDPCDAHQEMLGELLRLYDTTSLSILEIPDNETDIPTQLSIHPDNKTDKA